MTDERTGTIVTDRFRLEERLDTGGLGTVWRATDRERDVSVALKCEHDDAHDREQVRAHFRGELGWFRRFDGGPVPGSLVRFVDGAAGGERAYIATELVRGGSVADRFGSEATSDSSVSRFLAPSLETVREIGGPVCRALAFLHRNGVAHLDLTPSNVLVRQSGRPAVIDLNAAVSTDSGPDVSFRRDPFKPPELTRGGASDAPIGQRSDVYALAAFLAFLASGTASTESAASIDEWDPIDLARETTAPAALAEPIRCATASDPDDRFADADALYDALVSFLEVPAQSAHLVHESSGHVVRVRPGDTLGRWTPDDPVPTVVLPDDERFCCPEHATLEVIDGDGDNADSDGDDDTDSDDDDGATWRLRDRSLNGTYVRKESDWEYLLSREGLERRHDADAPLPASEPPTSIALSDGDCIAPVNPDYGCRLVFRTETGSQD